MNESPSQNNIPERNEGQDESLESARMFGQQYTELVNVALGKSDRESFLNNPGLDPKIRQVTERAQGFQEEQVQRQSEKNMDAHALLSQVFHSDDQQKLLEDRSKYRMEELSKGIYAVFLEPSLAQKLHRAEATAVMLRDGISFIMIQELTDPEQQKRNLEENIPHETHHLVWQRAGGQNEFPCNEEDPDIRESFLLFRDELMARASTDGWLAGYHHISKLKPSQRDELEKRAPGKADTIIARVAALNEFLGEIAELLVRSETVSRKELLKAVANASTFEELDRGLRRMKAVIESEPLKPADTGPTW